MTRSEFQTLIQGKFFVELSTDNSVLSFTGLGEDSSNIRNDATEAGVLVFLSTINKIFARGTYYGISNEDWTTLSNKVDELDTAIQSIGTPLAGLAALVQQNQTAIGNNASAIEANTKRLLGDATITIPTEPVAPADPNDAEYQAALAEYIAAKNAHDGLLNRVTALEGEIAGITGNSGGLTQAVNNLVDNRLNEVLNNRISDYLTANDYITSSDLSTIETDISDLQTALVNKVATSDFSALSALIGASSLSDTTHWNHPITDQNDPNNGQNKSIVTVVNELFNTTQTLETHISGIPHFEVRVVRSTANGEPNVPVAERNSATIYLVTSPSDEQEKEGDDLFTEYIWVNKNAAYTSQDPIPTNPDTNEPYTIEMVWEKLGRQAFKMVNYFTKDELQPLMDELESWINQNAIAFTEEYEEQLEENTSNIETIQGQITTIQTALNVLLQNGEFKLTGEDIKTTSDQNSNTIAEDIEALQNSKLDSAALSWVIISDSINNTQQNNGE